jgi:hypothetical protein
VNAKPLGYLVVTLNRIFRQRCPDPLPLGLPAMPLDRPDPAPARSGLTHPAHKIRDRLDDEFRIVALYVVPGIGGHDVDAVGG